MRHEPSYGFSLSVVSTQLGVILLRRSLLYAPAPPRVSRLSRCLVSRLLWCTETCESLLLARVCTRSMLGSCAHLSRRVPYMCNTGGVVDTKVGFFGVKSTNVPLGADGTKPAKVAHRPSWPTKAEG